MIEWSNIQDELPESEIILVTDGQQVRMTRAAWLYRSPDGMLRTPANYGAGMNVTYWMPLPEPPKEAQGDVGTNI